MKEKTQNCCQSAFFSSVPWICDTYFFCNDASLRQSIFALLFLKTNPLENCALRKLSLLLTHPRLLLRLVRHSGNFFVKKVTSP